MLQSRKTADVELKRGSCILEAESRLDVVWSFHAAVLVKLGHLALSC
jgi:hypothetical protein